MLELLGSGGMAKVYRAEDREEGREVALKFLREQYAENAAVVQRFRYEAREAALDHPNVVAVHGEGRSDSGAHYLVMEYLPAGTLSQKIEREGSMDPAAAVEVAVQVAEALRAAHDRGIVHRDIKPQNVLLSRDGGVKVGDFGIARAASLAGDTQTSLVFGTAGYMPPERSLGDPAGPASDLYSLGVVLYEMLTGRQPFTGDTPVATSLRHINEPPPPLREARPDLSESLEAVVMKLLEKLPENRYAAAAELVADLRRVQRGRASEAMNRPAETRRSPVVQNLKGSNNGAARNDRPRSPAARAGEPAAAASAVASEGSAGTAAPESEARLLSAATPVVGKRRLRAGGAEFFSPAFFAVALVTLIGLVGALVWSNLSSGAGLGWSGGPFELQSVSGEEGTATGEAAAGEAVTEEAVEEAVEESVFVHLADPENISSNSTYLDDPLANGNPGAVLLVTANWNPGESGVYNDHPTGVWYDETVEQWAIFNQDLEPMPEGTAFNVLVREAPPAQE